MPYGRRGSETVVNSQLTGSQLTPSVAGFASGGFIVVWSTTDTAQDGAGRAIKAQRYDSNGVPIGAEMLINSAAAGDQRAPSVTTLANGGYVITWETTDTAQDGSGTAIKGQLFDSSGAAVGAEFRVNSQLVADQTKSAVTALEGGGFVVTWQSADPAQDGHTSAIKGQIYTAAGVAVGSEFLVNSGAVGGESSPSVTSLAGGGFVATWTLGSGTSADVYAQVFTSSGAKSGGQFIVSSTSALNQDFTSVSHISGGRFVVTWTSASSLNTNDVEIRARIFSASGTPIGNDFAVSTARFHPDTGAYAGTSSPNVVDLPNGGFLITWTFAGTDANGSSIRGQYYDSAGVAVGGEVLISTVTNRVESSSDLAVDGNGSIFSVWSSANSTITDYDIHGQVLTPAGAPEIISNGGGSFAAFSVAENQLAVTTVRAIDPEESALTFSIVGGVDAARFTIDATTGALTFVQARNFEQRQDFGGNNVYDVVVSVSDGINTDIQAIAVTITNVNEGVTLTGGQPYYYYVENGTAPVADFDATDADGDPVTYSLSGADAARFTIDSAGVLRFAASPNFEARLDAGANNVYDVTVSASDGSLSSSYSLSVEILNQNEGPVIVSGGGGDSFALSVPENTGFVMTIVTADPDATPSSVTYAIAGGADASKFTINASTGQLFFISGRNFEAPSDVGADNVYNVIVSASDGFNAADTQAIAVTVTNVNEAVTITSNGAGASANISIAENSLAVTTVTATDPDGTVPTFSIAGGADAALFTIDSATGVLRFLTAPNFEAPADAGANNVYNVIVAANDGSLTDTQALAVTVTGVNEDIVLALVGAFSIGEDQTAVGTVVASDPDGAPLSYAIAGGADAALFAVDPSTGALRFVSAPNFEAPGDSGGDNVYNVIVSVSDGVFTRSQAVSVTVGNVNEGVTITSGGGGAAASVSVAENGSAVTTVIATDVDGTAPSYAIAGGADAGLFAIDSATGALSFVSAPDFEAPGDADGDNVYDVIVSASDGVFTDSQALEVTVRNVNEDMPSYRRWGGEFAVNTFTAANQTAPAITYFANGGFVIVWGTLDPAQDGSESAIKAQLFDAAGNKVGAEFRVNSAALGSQFTPAVATLSDGSFVVSWVTTDTTQDGDGDAIKAQHFSSTGAPIGGEFLVNTQTLSSQFTPNVAALANGGFVISWDDWNGFDMKAQIYDANGARVGGEIRLNTNTSAFQEYGDIVGLANGGFVATWRTTDTSADGSGQAVKAQIFAASGAKVGAEFLVNSQTAGDQYSPVTAALSGGGFVITWYSTDTAQDGSGSALKAQIFSASGVKVGSEFLVNTQTADSQREPTVTALPDGGFMIAWSTLHTLQDGNASAIKAQVFSASGTKVGAEMLVNTLATGSQFLPDIATLADGRVVISWTSESGDGSGYAVRAQIFAPNHAPVINSDGGGSSAAFIIDEGRTAITTVTATDADGPNPVRYAIAGGADAALFVINTVTGALSLAAAPDYEAPIDGAQDNFYNVTVSASDGDLSSFQSIQVLVRNVNEGLSITSPGAVSVGENQAAVAIVTATDQDGDAVTYAIAGGADAALFAIDAATGALRFVSAPDFEAPGDTGADNVYDVIVSASDGSFTDTKALAVSVGNVNEGVTITSGGSALVAEGSLVAANVVAVDVDGDVVTYSIAGGADATLFTIDSTTGALSFVSAPDFEAPGDSDGDNVYDVIVSASDGALSDERALAVTVGNVNEGLRIVSNGGGSSAALSIDEGVTAITTVIADDTDGPSGITYFISGGADAALFAIDASTGALRLLAAPDYEAPIDGAGDNFYNVIVSASDGEFSANQLVQILVRNVNEGLSIISSASASIPENGTAVMNVAAVDVDGDAVTYAIAGGADAARFAIDSATGALRFLSAPNFEAPSDAGGNNVYDVIVSASDGSFTDSRAVAVTVTNVNDIAPMIAIYPDSVTWNIPENLTYLLRLQASDAEGAAIAYSLTGPDSSLFTIDALTGALSWVSPQDFETWVVNGFHPYHVNVVASDGLLTDTLAITINLTDVNEPLVITSGGGAASASFTTGENNGAVTRIAAADEDRTAPVYSIAGGADAARFTIDSATGDLRFIAAPDYEAPADADGDNVYEVVVAASDGSFTDSQALTVLVGNVNEAPTIVSNGGGASAGIPVAENELAVTTVAASDPEGGALTYAISGGADAARFSIDSATGALRFIAAPDYEASSDAGGDNVYDVIVSASDGSFTDTQVLAVAVGNVNEGVTIYSSGGGSSASLNVSENGTAVADVGAFDADGGPVTYAIAGGADASRFAIDAATGALRFLSAPNYEAPTDAGGNNVYDVIVSASDGVFTDTQALAVAVGNVNEGVTINSNGGGSSAALTLSENATTVATVAAVDADGTPVTYAIAGGADASRFAIDATTGVLRFLSAPNYEAPTDAGGNNVYDVIVSASDGVFTDTQALAVTITNVNEAVTINSSGGGNSASLTVNENATAVATVVAVDADGTPVTYAIAGGADAARFAIDATTGVLRFLSAPNYEAPTDAGGNNVYDVIVSASDGVFTDTQALAITIANVNEAVTINSNGGGNLAVLAVAENSLAITTVAATDADGGAVTYAIAGGADAARFTIDPATGALRFVTAPNYEAPADAGANNSYDVIVSASDGAFTDTQTLTVMVTNVREGNTITGTSANNTISTSSTVSGQPKASEGEDTIYGLGGADTISGAGGGDYIDGGDGNDSITGGLGADWLIGGTGADKFIYTATSESTAAARDVIADFSRAEGDQISLTAIDANANAGGNQNFIFIGSNAFSGVAGQLRFEIIDGHTLISADVNGDRVADFQIELSTSVPLVSTDFLL